MTDDKIIRDIALHYCERDRLNLDVALGNLTAYEADRLAGEAQVWLIVNGPEDDD